MPDWVYVVTGHGSIWVFADESDAEKFAAIRGGCEMESYCIIGNYDADAMIKEEIKDRRDEERMREAGL